MAGKLLTGVQVAEILHLSIGTINRFRLRGDGPKYIKVGHKVRYRESDIEAYLRAREMHSTSDNAQICETPEEATE